VFLLFVSYHHYFTHFNMGVAVVKRKTGFYGIDGAKGVGPRISVCKLLYFISDSAEKVLFGACLPLFGQILGTVTNGRSLRHFGTYYNRIGEGTRLNWQIRCFAEKHRKNRILGDFVHSRVKPSIIGRKGGHLA